MRTHRLLLWLSIVAALAAPALTQQHTLARLSPESSPDRHADLPASAHGSRAGAELHDSAASRAAGEALFTRSDLQRARGLSDHALHRDNQDAEALFVRMELAEMQGDRATALEAAVRLCEAGASAPADPRVRLSAARLREAAADTPAFRAVVRQLQALASDSPAWRDLQLALLNAAMDGVPGLDPYALARAAGILSDWRIVGPVGSRSLLENDQPALSSDEDLAQDFRAGRAVENFQFPDGWIRLPDYFPRHGVFYATAKFASFTSETRQLRVESAGSLEIYIDGRRVVRTGAAPEHNTVKLAATPGPHRVLVKFVASATPLRVAVFRESPSERTPLRAGLSPGEATYLLAAEHYADGEFAAAARQIDAAEPASPSAALQSLRTQALENSADRARGTVGEEFGGNATSADRTDEASLWVRRLAQHPSCAALEQAMAFYDSRGMTTERDAAQQKLNGCAPESLAYARSLGHDGRHKEAAEALRRLLAGAPLNREAQYMLIGELQLAGDDAAAQQAAAEWLRIAPNAGSYHRLAASADIGEEHQSDSGEEGFYKPYRIDAATVARQSANAPLTSLVLLDDHVAIARPDGSVSLYVHTAGHVPATGVADDEIPLGAQVLTRRILHADGAATDLAHGSAGLAGPAIAPAPGDVIDAEYVVNFTGDGGIPEHAEAFQVVFGNFDGPVLHARFVVLTPADHGDGGVVITTGVPPSMTTTVRNGMLQRVWETTGEGQDSRDLVSGSAIVRVVEQDNGWSVPSNAEHQRRIETIHPGPRPQDS